MGTAHGTGRFAGLVRIGAADLGTGTWTTFTQIAADALGCAPEAIRLQIGDTDLPNATVAGGSSGISSWGWTIVAAARELRRLQRDRRGEAIADARRVLRRPDHIATNADVVNLDAAWLDEVDDRSTPMGSRGIGEIGIVGAAAAIANAVYHATGKRIRTLPITPDKLLT